MRKADGTTNGSFAWSSIPTGGGGYTTCPLINPFGRQAVGTDTSTGYIRDKTDAKWVPIFTATTIQSFGSGTKWSGFNCNWLGYAPSDTNRWYGAFWDAMYRIDIDPAKKLTDPGAITCTKFNLADKWFMSGAGFSRWMGENCSIVVHPTDKNTVLFGTNNDGVYYTTDGGANVSSITIPAGKGYCPNAVTDTPEIGRERYCVAIDQSNPLYCYIFAQGTSLYRSTAGVAGPYTAVANSPTSCACMAVNANGAVWLVGEDRINMLTNSTFEPDTSGWTAGNSATLSRNVAGGGGELKVLNSAATAGYAYQAYTTVVGQSYAFGGTVRGYSTAGGVIKIGTAPGLSDIASLTLPAGSFYSTSGFTATGTTTYISLVVGSSVSGAITYFDDPIVASAGTFKLTTRGGSTWSSYGDVIGSFTWPHHIAIDPFDATGNSVLVWREQVGARFDGTSWSGQMNFVIASGGECAWRPKPAPQGGGWAFDPTTQNRLIGGEGFGVVEVTSYKVATIQAKDYSKGVEGKIDRTFMHHTPTGKNFIVSWDLARTRIDSLSTYTNMPSQGVIEDGSLVIGAGMDWAIDDPNFIVQTLAQGQLLASYSTQGGAPNTFHQSPSALPSAANTFGFTGQGVAAGIAVSNKSDIVVTPGNASYASETYDSGATWNPVMLNGSKDYTAADSASFITRLPVASDKQRPGWFAMVTSMSDPGTSNGSSALAGLWVRPGSHQTWTRVITGNINGALAGSDTGQTGRCQLAFVPGYAGEMLYTPHDVTVDPLWYITTDGTSGGTTKVQFGGTAVRNVKQFGFGKLPPGATGRPAVYFYGDYNGVTGMWVTYDWGVTFIQMSNTYPGGLITVGTGAGVGGDQAVFGRAFCVVDGLGSVYSTYQDVAHAT